MTTEPTSTSTATTRTTTRLDIATGRPFDDFREAFEAAVPALSPEQTAELVTAAGSWADVERLTAERATHDFLLYATLDTTPMMAVAGHDRPAVEYLMGNHVLAERMFRHHPAALLYAPLRVLLHADDHGRAVLVLDQPSTVFASLGSAEVDKTGTELDRKLAALLEALHVAVPEELLAP